MSDDEGITPESEWTQPFSTTAYGWRCVLCKEPIQFGDYIQRPKIGKHRFAEEKVNPQQLVVHYDCDDPAFKEGFATAAEDQRKEDARGHKSEVNSFFRRHFERNRGK